MGGTFWGVGVCLLSPRKASSSLAVATRGHLPIITKDVSGITLAPVSSHACPSFVVPATPVAPYKCTTVYSNVCNSTAGSSTGASTRVVHVP